MTDTPQPEVFLTKESKDIRSKRNWKPIITIIITLIIAGIVFGGIYYRSQIKKTLLILNGRLGINQITTILNQTYRSEPKVIIQTRSPAPITNTKPQPTLFFADLKYNPKDNTVILKKISTGVGNPTPLTNRPTEIQSDNFAYQIEVVSNSNELTQLGWITDKLAFTLRLLYQPNSLVRVYSADRKLIWIGRMV